MSIVILIVIVIVASIIAVSIVNNEHSNKEDCMFGGLLLGFFITVVMTASIAYVFKKENPRAIDVYRNNTELEIKYTIVNNDTTSIDSTVIFKNNV